MARRLVAGSVGASSPHAERALGLAAALSLGLGDGEGAADALRRLRGAFGGALAAALLAEPDVPVASLTLAYRDWIVLQCYRAGRAVPPALSADVDAPDLEPLRAIETLAHAALASPDPHAVVAGLSDWLASADDGGLDEHVQQQVLAPLHRTVVRLGLRGCADPVEPGAFGLVLRDCIDSQYRSEMRWEVGQLADRLTALGYDGLVAALVQESSGWGISYADAELAALLHHGRNQTAAQRFADILADSARPPVTIWDGVGVLPSGDLPTPVVAQLLQVAWDAPPSASRTASLAQLAALSPQAAEGDRLVAQVAALIDPWASTGRWAGHPNAGARLIEREILAAVPALLDLARPADPPQGLALVRAAWRFADPIGPLSPFDRGGVDRAVARALGRLPAAREMLTEPERRLVHEQAALYALGRVEQGLPPDPGTTSAAPQWVRTLVLQTLAAQDRWIDAVTVAVNGSGLSARVQRLGQLARSCADLDTPDALPGVLAAVESLGLGDDEVRAARGQVLRGCLEAESWSW